MEPDNRRKFHRVDFDGMVNLQFTNNRYDCCQVKNISLTGMFVQGNFLKQKKKDCIVKVFHNNESEYNCLQATGTVVWSNEEGAGLKFTTMSFESYMLLLTTLRDHAEHPETILRNLPNDFPYEVSSM